MKLKSIIIAAIALTCLGSNAWADTDKLTAADGWTKITSVPTSSEIANNYYVFVDATRDLMLGIGKGVHQDTKWYSLGVYYRSSVEPTAKDFIPLTWTLESYSGGFALRNLDQPVYAFQTEWGAAWKYDTNDVTTPNEWTPVNFTLADGVWTLQNGKYPESGYIGPWDDANFTNGAECAANKSGANVGKFHIYAISRAQFKQNLLDNASGSNPVDLTPWYVTNATFDAGNRTGWTEEGSGGNNNTSERGGGCEIWHRSNFKIYQNLTLPNGKYKVSVQIAGTTGAGQVYGTSGSTTKTVTSSAAAGDNFQNTVLSMIQDRTYGKVTTDEIEVSNGSLQMGMQCSTSDQWLVFDNFKLYCIGVDLSAYETQLSELVGECNSFISSAVVPDACESAISSAVTTYNQSYSTAKEYSNAIVALTAVLDSYRNDTDLQAAYAAYKTMRTNVQGLEDTGTYKYTDSGSAKSTFDSAISSANTAVEAATTASAINTQTDNIRAAAMTFISSVTAEDGNPFNLTFLASTAASDWQTASGLNAAATAPAWSVPKPDESMADFIESYTQAEGGESITGNILYQTISGMPAGYYTVALYAAASYTPGRGLPERCTDGQPNITYGFAGDNSLSLPVYHRTTLTAADQVPVNLSVQLASSGDLTFGIKKTAAGSNWHVAQIYTITYSKDPDLTILKADRDALVSEAEGVLASADASLLTTAQQSALSSAISTANSANTFDALTTVTLTTLPNAIQTARQQIQTVKENRVLMIAALERFENDYNLADGTDYRRSTMSAKAWTDLLDAVDDVTTALDDVSQASNYGTLKDALVAQMDATDASLRLFKSYKAMVEGTTALSIVGSYGADANMDTDATEQAAITALNTAFGTYANAQDADFSVSAFLGENLDFSAAAGSVINGENSNTIKNVTGWEVNYADADTWAVLQTDQNDNAGKLYIRKNWGSAATTLTVLKEKMLPVGKYRLSLSWNSNMENMTNRSQFKLGETATAIGEATEGAQTLTYDFEVTTAATPFDLTIGFQKTGTDNTPAQLIVDDVTLTLLRSAEDLLARDYNPAALWFDATDSKYAAAKGVKVTPTADNQIIRAAAADQFSGLTKNVIVSGTCANLEITDGAPLEVRESFTATTVSYARSMSNAWGTVILPFALTSGENVQFYSLKASDDVNMTFSEVSSVEANTPVALQKLNGDGITITDTNVEVATTTGSQVDITTAFGWTAEGSYTSQSIADYEGIYYIASNKFWAADGTMTVNPFRAIFRYNGSSSVKSFNISLDTADAINQIVNDHSDNREWYDLTGRRVQTMKKNGVYIRDGKKVIVK